MVFFVAAKVDDTHFTPFVFRNYGLELGGGNGDAQVTVVDAIAAATAAPW